MKKLMMAAAFPVVAAPWLVGALLPALPGTAAAVATGLIGTGISIGGCLAIGVPSGDEKMLYELKECEN